MTSTISALVEAAKLVEYEKDGTPIVTKSSKICPSSRLSDFVGSIQKSSMSVGNTLYKKRRELEEDLESRKGRPGGTGTRETHNKLEKNRRAELKNYFQKLKSTLPKLGDRAKSSNVSILTEATRYVEELTELDKEYERERLRLHKCRLCYEERIKMLKEDIHRHNLQSQLFVQVQQEKNQPDSNPVSRKEMKTVEVQANEQDIKDAMPDEGSWDIMEPYDINEDRCKAAKKCADFSDNYNAPLYERALSFNHETKFIMQNFSADAKEPSDEFKALDAKRLKKGIITFIENEDSEDELKLVVDDKE